MPGNEQLQISSPPIFEVENFLRRLAPFVDMRVDPSDDQHFFAIDLWMRLDSRFVHGVVEGNPVLTTKFKKETCSWVVAFVVGSSTH